MSPIVLDHIAKGVLSKEQQKLLPLLEEFSRTHFLVGGTAVALHLGHRESIDFDYFSRGSQGSFADLIERIEGYGFDVSDADKANWAGAEFEPQDEIHVIIEGVRWSIMNYDRTLYRSQEIHLRGDDMILGGLRIASTTELIMMKLYAMITRKKWKDAVDLFFLLRYTEISLEKALEIAESRYYIGIFNSLAVLEQLISMDWDTTESVHYLIDNPPRDEEVCLSLRDQALRAIQIRSSETA